MITISLCLQYDVLQVVNPEYNEVRPVDDVHIKFRSFEPVFVDRTYTVTRCVTQTWSDKPMYCGTVVSDLHFTPSTVDGVTWLSATVDLSPFSPSKDMGYMICVAGDALRGCSAPMHFDVVEPPVGPQGYEAELAYFLTIMMLVILAPIVCCGSLAVGFLSTSCLGVSAAGLLVYRHKRGTKETTIQPSFIARPPAPVAQRPMVRPGHPNENPYLLGDYMYQDFD